MSFSQTPITRRQALEQTFFFSAALALAAGVPALRAEAARDDGRDFLMLGDFGALGPDGVQASVAAAMKDYVAAQRLTPDALFLLGDNFYGAMDGGVESARWRTGFEEMYPASVFPGPCWAMLGNHDYDEESGRKVAAELGYAAAHPQTRWTMPAKWYRIDWPARSPLVTFLVLDSNYRNNFHQLTADEKAAQLRWLKEELAKPRKAPWFVCLAHHPLYSNGAHGDTPALIADWGPLFQQSGVPFYFCGHDHDLQHLEFKGASTSFVVSGGGGAHTRALRTPERGPFSQATYGFTHLHVTPERFTVRHVDQQRRVLHAFARTLGGKVEMLG